MGEISGANHLFITVSELLQGRLNTDRPDVFGFKWWLLTDQLAFVPGLAVLIGFHDKLLLLLIGV